MAYCVTAWDGPGAGLAELRATVLHAAAAYGLRLTDVRAEVADDDADRRKTLLLARTIGVVHADAADILLIAESPTLLRSRGAAAQIARDAGLGGNRVITVATTEADLVE